MKSMTKFLGIAAVIAVIGFITLPLTGCPEEDDGGGNSGGGGGPQTKAGTPISSVNITIAAPVKDVAPATTATGTGNFTIGAVTWSPSDNPFKGDVAYTARVTLTANEEFTFTGLTADNAKINGQNATVSSNTGGNVTLSHTFAKTSNKTVLSVAITAQPTKTSYTYGETLDLTGLVVTLTYGGSDGSENVGFASFASNNITASPAHGDMVTVAQSNHPVTIACGGQTATTSNLTISAKDITSTMTIEDIANQTWTGSAITPAVVVKDGTTTLIKDADYTVSYSDNTAIGTATVSVTCIGNYSGSGNKTFSIIQKNISSATIENIADQTYNGSTITPTVVVKDGSATLTLDTDYTVSYSNNTNAGTATVTVSGKGNYTGTANKSFTIKPMAITPTIDSIAGVTYNGSAHTPSVTVKDGSTTLTLNTHYTVSYSNNTNAGTATVSVTCTGNYSGTNTQTFTINKAALSVTDFDISGLYQLHNGSAKTVTITPKSGMTGVGAVSNIRYNNSTTAPSALGSYTVLFNVAAGDNYLGLTNASAGSMTIVDNINSVDDLLAYLSSQPANTAATAYTVKVNIDLSDPANNVKIALLNNGTKYVNLDFSGSTFTSIYNSTFNNCKTLVGITIPNSVASIMDSAFYFCTSLTSVTIPNSVTSIERYAFLYCFDLTSVTFERNDNTTISQDIAFLGNLVTVSGGTGAQNRYGTYTTSSPVSDSSTWTKQP
jgi:hypothetical protein